MASHIRDNLLHGKDHAGDHASDNRWRHQESRSYARHAQGPREADERHGSSDLAQFFNSSRVEPANSAVPGSVNRHKPIAVSGNVYSGAAQPGDGKSKGGSVPDSCTELEVQCGPLLNYRRMENETWFGSVLIVTRGGGLGVGPELQLVWKIAGCCQGSGSLPSQNLPADNTGTVNDMNGSSGEPYGTVNTVDYEGSKDPGKSPQVSSDINVANGTTRSVTNGSSTSDETKVSGTKLYSDPSTTFWRFDLQVPMQQSEIECVYSISGLKFVHSAKADKQSFFIPAISESMRIMFHSCNGFSVGTDEDAFSGAALWNDVIRVHEKTPFHVMLGGGDQIYNDGIRVKGPLRAW